MRLVVTSGSGFFGSHLIEALPALEHEVICIDNLATGDRENIDELFSNSSLTFIQQDVTLPIYVDGPIDFVVHLASVASPAFYINRPIQTLKVGSLGTLNGLGLAKAKKASFLLTSTSEVYGDPSVNPQPESYWGNVNPIGLRSSYDESKRFAEALAMAYHRHHQIDIRIVRIFNTYGPRMRADDGRVIPAFINQALSSQPLTVFGDGSQTRSLCYVSDTVDAILRLMDVPYSEPINIGNPEEITVLELAEKIKELTGSSSPIEFRPLPEDDPKQRRPDIIRAKEILGWKPSVGLEDGLRKTIEWVKANR